MFTKKGQSALEFLTTYGWAFLVALIMIGALAYFGILNPSRYLPERCNFGTEVDCTDFIVDASGTDTMSLRLTNNFGESVKITNVEINTSGGAAQPGCTLDFTASSFPEAAYPINWIDGGFIDFVFGGVADPCNFESIGVVSGTKGKVQVKLTYYAAKSSPTYSHDVFGEVYASIK